MWKICLKKKERNKIQEPSLFFSLSSRVKSSRVGDAETNDAAHPAHLLPASLSLSLSKRRRLYALCSQERRKKRISKPCTRFCPLLDSACRRRRRRLCLSVVPSTRQRQQQQHHLSLLQYLSKLVCERVSKRYRNSPPLRIRQINNKIKYTERSEKERSSTQL